MLQLGQVSVAAVWFGCGSWQPCGKWAIQVSVSLCIYN